MTEQKRRAEYFKRTGRIATSDQSGYFAFCQGIEYEREACAKVAEGFRCGTCGMDGAAAAAIRKRHNVKSEGLRR